MKIDTSDFKWLLISVLIVLLPMLIGKICWSSLPDMIATHFGANGKADTWTPKKFTVYILPLIFLGLQILMFFVLELAGVKTFLGNLFYMLLVFLIPFASTLAYIIIYTNALKK